MMNLMDLLPVDWLPWAAGYAGIPYLKVVPTTDVNVTFGMSISVFFLMIFYSIKVKGGWGFSKEFLFHPIPPATRGVRAARRADHHRVQLRARGRVVPRAAGVVCRCDCSATCTPAS